MLYYTPLHLQKSLLAAAMVALLGACAAPAPVEEVEETPELVWPAPPETARIRYVDSLTSLSNEKEKKTSRFTDILAGSEEEDENERRFIKPRGVHADANGRVYVTDSGQRGLVVYDTVKDQVEFWGEEGPGTLSQPVDSATDRSGRLYVTDQAGSRVVVFGPDGEFESAFGGPDVLGRPVGIAVDDSAGRIYVSDSQNHKIAVFNRQGDLVEEFGEHGRGDGEFNFPTFLNLGSDGSLYVADSMNFRVQVILPQGGFERNIGEMGRGPGTFSRLKGVAIDRDSNVYAVDGAFNNFQIFDSAGELLLIVGTGGNTAGAFGLPTDIAIDENDRIYVVDSVNQRVQIFQYLPVQD